MPFDPNVTFQQAEQSRMQKLSIAKQRRVPDPLGVIEEASRRHTYHIFNVGPWPQRIGLGSMGWFYVPGCPLDKPYVEAPSQIKGVESELTIKDEFEYNRLMTDGWKFAEFMLGLGRGSNTNQALTHYGLFASKNAVPTEEELSTARLRLHKTCGDIVQEARDEFAQDRKRFNVIVKPVRHHVAAKVLNLKKEPWMTETTPSEAKECPYCGSVNEDVAIKCRSCHEIINVERYRALKDREAEVLGTEPPKRGPGRPAKVQPEV